MLKKILRVVLHVVFEVAALATDIICVPIMMMGFLAMPLWFPPVAYANPKLAKAILSTNVLDHEPRVMMLFTILGWYTLLFFAWGKGLWGWLPDLFAE